MVSKKLLPIGETQESADIADALSRLIAAMGPMSDTRILLVAVDIIACLKRYKDGVMSAEQVCEKWGEEAAYCIEQGKRYREEAG